MSVASGINIWTPEQIEERRAEGRALARKYFPGDAKWENRIVSLAQGISHGHWLTFQTLPKKMIESVIEQMIAGGAPFDLPFDTQAAEAFLIEPEGGTTH